MLREVDDGSGGVIEQYQTLARLQGVLPGALGELNFTPRIDPNGGPTPPIVDNGTANNDNIFGTLGNDTLNGGAGSDRIFGSWGDDTITGGAGYNWDLSGGAGNDSITGGDDGNFIRGGDGNDTLTGGRSGDFIVGESGSDTIHAGLGNDTIDETIARPDDADVINAGGGNDTINYSVDYSNQTLVDAANSINAGDGNDNIVAYSNLLTIDAGAGNDTVNSNQATITLGSGADTISVHMLANLTVTDFTPGEDTINIDYLLIDIGGAYIGRTGWNGITNPFAANGFLRVVQDTATPADTLLQVLRETETFDNNGIPQYSYSFETVTRLQNVQATAITNDAFNPPWKPDGTGTAPNYTPHANPDVAPYGGTDSIQFAAFTPEAGIEMWRLGSDGSLTQISNTALEALPNVAAHIQVGNAMYFNLVDPATGNHQIFYNTSDQGRGGYSTHLNEAKVVSVVDNWIEFGGALYFRASAVNPADAEPGFHAGIFRLDSATSTPVPITDESAGDPFGFFGPAIVEWTSDLCGGRPHRPFQPRVPICFRNLCLRSGCTRSDQDHESTTSSARITQTRRQSCSEIRRTLLQSIRMTGSHQLYKLTVPARSSGPRPSKAHLNQSDSRSRHGRGRHDRRRHQDFPEDAGLPRGQRPFEPWRRQRRPVRLRHGSEQHHAPLSDDGVPSTPQGFFLPAVIGGVLYWGAFSESEGPGTWHLSCGRSARVPA